MQFAKCLAVILLAGVVDVRGVEVIHAQVKRFQDNFDGIDAGGSPFQRSLSPKAERRCFKAETSHEALHRLQRLVLAENEIGSDRQACRSECNVLDELPAGKRVVQRIGHKNSPPFQTPKAPGDGNQCIPTISREAPLCRPRLIRHQYYIIDALHSENKGGCALDIIILLLNIIILIPLT